MDLVDLGVRTGFCTLAECSERANEQRCKVEFSRAHSGFGGLRNRWFTRENRRFERGSKVESTIFSEVFEGSGVNLRRSGGRNGDFGSGGFLIFRGKVRGLATNGVPGVF